MAWRKGRGETDTQVVEIFVGQRGVVIEGTPSAVSVFVDQMLEATKEANGRSRHVVLDGVQTLANVAAYRQTHREYFEFSERALRLIKDHGAIPTTGGHFRSFVRSGRHFAGNLDWKPAKLSPEQALGMQAMAGQLAIRAAIKDVAEALVRIEGKVDTLVRLAEAERLGAVIADRATLLPLVQRARSTGEISLTDWTTVASLGPVLLRSVEVVRAYVARQLTTVEDVGSVYERARAAEDLTDRMMRESLALLVVAEENYTLWQELRLVHVTHHEKLAVAATSADIEQQLTELAARDQRLVDALCGAVDRLLEPSGWEGFAPLKRRQLEDDGRELDELAGWFSDQRNLDLTASSHDSLPEFRASIEKAKGTIATAAKATAKAVGEFADRHRTAEPTGGPESPKELGA